MTQIELQVFSGTPNPGSDKTRQLIQKAVESGLVKISGFIPSSGCVTVHAYSGPKDDPKTDHVSLYGNKPVDDYFNDLLSL